MYPENNAQPLVSVIIRSMGRDQLADALESVASQTYPNIEAVVVNARGPEHQRLAERCGPFPLRICGTGETLPRSRAANLGLDSANGKYLIFLDDDDVFYPEHVSGLVEALERNPGARAAYAGVRVIYSALGEQSGLLNEEYNPARLVGENFLPIHAVLFEKALLELGCRFDEELEIYEDWDFWLQVAAHTTFVHVAAVTACYRVSDVSICAPGADQDENRKHKAKFFDKWKSLWRGQQVVDLLEYLESRRVNEVHSVNAASAEKDLVIARKDAELGCLREDVANLNAELLALLSSRSWQITKPLREFANVLRRGRATLRAIFWYVRTHGGGFGAALGMLRKAFRILVRFGPRGLAYKVKQYIEKTQGGVASPLLPIPGRVYEGVAVVRDVPLVPHAGAVDVIVCVHNALEDVKNCLSSVVRHSTAPYNIILVDDGSGPETSDYLHSFAESHQVLLLRNEAAKGYTLAANQGMRASGGEYVVLLNSDTVVGPEWLDRMVMCAESDPMIGVVGPLSNTASWQSIPEFEENGDWASNALPEGMTVAEMASLVAVRSPRVYPRIPFLNGFCILVKRQVLEEVGHFDEEAFGAGYGEENDYCLRVRKMGWALAIADDTYVFHAQSKSYSTERRKKLSEQAGIVLMRKHGQQLIDEGVSFCREDRVLVGMRSRARYLLPRQALVKRAQEAWQGKRILFVLPVVNAGGGANVVISEARALVGMGLDVWLLNLAQHRVSFEHSYPALDLPVIYSSSEDEVAELSGFDAVIATANQTVRWLKPLARRADGPVLGYYIQDFEPYFFPEGSPDFHLAKDSYSLIPGIVQFTKTRWNLEEIRKQVGVDCALIGPSMDVDLFVPRPRSVSSWPLRPLRICAMVRPNSPRRAPRRTMEVLRDIYRTHAGAVEIVLFGVESHDPGFLALPRDFEWSNRGLQTPEQLALLFNDSDIFVDFSSFQAMGLTAMEAMGCGAAVILPAAGGADSFASHERNALVIDTGSHESCYLALERLLTDHALRVRLQHQAIEDVAQHYPEAAAFKMLQNLFNGPAIGVHDRRPSSVRAA